jgi:hypothetical protein
MKIAQLFLLAAAGRAHAECVAGDLEEEFASICVARRSDGTLSLCGVARAIDGARDHA